MIEIHDLLIRRDNLDALRVDSLAIERGETLALVGPNGAGKSTFLLALAHLIKPARGSISFLGKALMEWDDLAYRRKIAFVFQDPLLMEMSVHDNIALGLKFRGLHADEIRARVIKWSQAMGVHSLLNRRASQLSGGEAQRVSLARAFVLEPELLLMDEPFSALDPPTRAQLLKDLAKLLSHDQLTTIFVTHELEEAARVGDRLAVIIDGELKQAGTSKQLKAHPADKTVKEFLSGLR